MMTKTARYVAALTAILVVGSMSNAFAVNTNPYVTGYPTTGTITIHSQYTMKTNFSGVASGRSTNLGQVFSSAGFSSTTATDPTGWFYQHIVDLHTDNYLYGEEQTMNTGGCVWHCPVSSSNWEQLGHYGTASTDIDYVYNTFYWSGSPHNTVNFYFEPHFVNGSSTSAPIVQYSTGSFSDPSQYFATGMKNKTLSGNTYSFKFFQFGVESQSSNVTTAWNAKEYDMTFAGGTQSYNSQSTKATTPSTQTDYTKNTWITYTSTAVTQIGDLQYSAKAHAKNTDGTFAAGTVQWYEASPPIIRATSLW